MNSQKILATTAKTPALPSYDIRGVAVLHDDAAGLEIGAEIRICDGVIEITKCDGSSLATTAKIQAVHSAARRYVGTLASELHRIGYIRKEIKS